MFIDQCTSLPLETVTQFWTLDPENDVDDLLERVRVPTLLAHGAEDRDTPIAIAHAMAARIPGAALHVFEGKGHLPLFTATGEFCAMLRAFVAGSS
jgi:pimeloyl-ACP methyl ester carboxylesterase